MPLSIRVESVARSEIRIIGDDAQGTFMNICKASIGKTHTLGFVAPYSETIFNSFQLKTFVAELTEAIDRTELSVEQRTLLDSIRGAAEEAISKNGYLFIAGD